VSLRSFIESHPTNGKQSVYTTQQELVVDLRYFEGKSVEAWAQAFHNALNDYDQHRPDSQGGVVLEPFVRARDSVVWREFNNHFWLNIDSYMKGEADLMKSESISTHAPSKSKTK